MSVVYGSSMSPEVFLIVQQAVVGTLVNLAFNPNPALPNSSVTWSGKLTRADTGEGIPGQIVELKRHLYSPVEQWVLSATAITAADGSFAGTITSSSTPMTSGYRTEFAGATVGEIVYGESVSPETSLISAEPGEIQLDAPTLAGIGLLVVDVGLALTYFFTHYLGMDLLS